MSTTQTEGPEPEQSGPSTYHVPIMVREVIEALAPGPGRIILDGTLGGGGHARAVLEAGGQIIGLDQDMGAIGYCIPQLVVYAGDSVTLAQANFRHLEMVLDQVKIAKVDGIFFDLGVSSRQLDLAERGFSFSKPAPLDMRMNRSAPISARDIVNTTSEEELVRILRGYGEEPAARRIAGCIVRKRAAKSFETTVELADAVESVVPKCGPRHPATRTFQALRIAVNDEMGSLVDGLEAAARRLKPGGRLVVITFHSLEDRIVKRFCRETTASTLDRPEWPAPRPNPRCLFRALARKALQPSPQEIARNRRARSAKLRALERNSAPFSSCV